jgi:hypothetical protein
MGIKNVFGANNIDTSASRGSQVVREVKLWRRDFDKAKEEIIKSLRKDGNIDSPYAADRESIDQDRIHKAPGEKDWKKVEVSSGRDRWVSTGSNIKKLDII